MPAHDSKEASVRPIEFRLFGGPEIRVQGEIVPLGNLSYAALAVMAAHGRRGAAIDLITRLLWDDGDGDAARSRLSQGVSSLRSTLGNTDIATCVKGRYLLGVDVVSTDLEEFHLHLADQRIEEAAELMAKGFLPNLRSGPTGRFFDWVKERETRLRGEVRTLAAGTWEEGSNIANWPLAETAARALVALEPEREEHMAKMLQVLAIRGRTEETQAFYEAFQERKQVREPGWRPNLSTERILDSAKRLARSQSDRQYFRRIPGFGSPPLFGRSQEMATLRAVLLAPPDDAFQIVVVSGEPGIGKSRLVEEALRSAPLDGHQILRARCSSMERAIPLCPLITAMESDWMPAAISELPAPWSVVLAHILLNDTGAAEDELPGIDSGSVLRRTCEAFLRLLSFLARTQSLVLFLDDLQWADDTTLTVLEYVQRRWKHGSLTIVATMRADTGDSLRLPEAYRIPGFSGHTCILDLPPLGAAALETVLECLPTGSLSHEVRQRIISLSAGNPYFLLELTRTALLRAEQGMTGPQGLLPPALPDFVAERLESLSPLARDVLEYVACGLEPLAPEVIARAMRRHAEEVGAGLRDLRGFGWLKWCNRGASVHPELVRLAVLESLTPGRRAFVTRRLLEAFGQGRPEPDAGQECSQLVRTAYYHFLADDPDTATDIALKAVSVSRSTGEFRECISLLELLSGEPSAPADPRLLFALGEFRLSVGETGGAADAFASGYEGHMAQGNSFEAAACRLGRLRARYASKDAELQSLLEECDTIRRLGARRQWPEILADALDLQIRLADSCFNHAMVVELIEYARELYPQCEPSPRAQVSLLHSQALGVLYTPHIDTSVAAARAAVTLSNSLNEPHLQLKSYNSLVAALITLGRLEQPEGIEAARRLNRLASKAGDLLYRTYAKMNWAVWHIDTWRYDEAITLLQASLGELGSAGPQPARASVALNLALAYYRAGLRDEAESALATAESLFGPGASASAQATMLSLRGLLSMDGGNLATADQVAGQLDALPRPWPFDPTLVVELSALVSWRKGRRGEALRFVGRTMEALKERMPLHAVFLGDLEWRLARRGRFEVEAAAAAKRVLETLEAIHLEELSRRLRARYS
jgi:DNA-binding SARP family transcriptional activator/tetratricopeptide (TPR) repeat protein